MKNFKLKLSKSIMFFLVFLFVCSLIFSIISKFNLLNSSTTHNSNIHATHLGNNYFISTFNVLRLGHNNGKNYIKLADAIKDMDIIGLIEVMNKQGVEELVDALEQVSDKKWSYHISPFPVGKSDYKEFFAYVWQDESVVLLKEEGFYPDENVIFSRPPYGVTFKIQNFDFTFILVHSIFGNKKSQREAEAFYMTGVYEYFQGRDSHQKDIIIGGDFNLPANSSAFSSLLSYLDCHIIYSVDPTLKTTIGNHKMSNSYDNIFLSLLYTKEFTGVSGVIDFTEGNFPYSRKYISDHLPVFIEVDGSVDYD